MASKEEKILKKLEQEKEKKLRKAGYDRTSAEREAQREIEEGVQEYVDDRYPPGTQIVSPITGGKKRSFRFLPGKKEEFQPIPKERALVPYQRNLPATIGNADTSYERKLLPSGEKKLLPPGGPLYDSPRKDEKEIPPMRGGAGIDEEIVRIAADLTNNMPETPYDQLWSLFQEDPYIRKATGDSGQYVDYRGEKRNKFPKRIIEKIFNNTYNRRFSPEFIQRMQGRTGSTGSRARETGYSRREEFPILGNARAGWRRGMGYNAAPGVEGGDRRMKALYRSAINRGRVTLRRRAQELFRQKMDKLKGIDDQNKKEVRKKLQDAEKEWKKIIEAFEKEINDLSKKTGDASFTNILASAKGGPAGMLASAGLGQITGAIDALKRQTDSNVIVKKYEFLLKRASEDLDQARQALQNIKTGEMDLLKGFEEELFNELTAMAGSIEKSLIAEYSVNLPRDDLSRGERQDFQSAISGSLAQEASWLAAYFSNKARGRILRNIPSAGMHLRGLSQGSQTLGDVWNDVIGNLWSFLTGPWVLGGFVSFALFWMILTWSQNAAVVIAMASIGAAGVFFLNISNTKQPLDWLTHIISGWMIGSASALFLISLLGPDTIWNMSWGFIGAPFPFWILWIVLALFIGAFQIYSTGGYRMVFQLTVLIMLFTYVALGPYSGYYQQFIKPVRAAVGEIASTIGSAFGELWLLSTNPTKWYEMQQLRNVQSEKPFDRPKGVEITQVEALPPSVPASTEDDTQKFSILAVYRNEGDLDAKDIEFHVQCNEPQYCNANQSNVTEGETELLKGEGSVVEFTGLTSYIPIVGREAEFRVAEAQINLTYTYSTNSSLKITVMNKEEISRRQREGEDLFQPRKATAKNTPAKVSINVGPQPLPTDTERTLLVNVINTRDDGSVFLRQRSLLIVTLPNSIGTGLVCPEALGCTTKIIDNKERAICLIPKDIKIPPNKYTETNAAFLCRFKTASTAEVGVERTDVVTAELPDYGYVVTKKLEITINPPLGILDANVNIPDVQFGGLDFYIPHMDPTVNVVDPDRIKGIANSNFPNNNIDRWDEVISRTRAAGINPAFAVAIWWEEGGFGGAGANSEFGCFPGGDTSQHVGFDESLQCFIDFTLAHTNFGEWVSYFCGPNQAVICGNNPNFLNNIKTTYQQVVPAGNNGELVYRTSLKPLEWPATGEVRQGPYDCAPTHCVNNNQSSAIDIHNPEGVEGTPIFATQGGTLRTFTDQYGGIDISIDDGRYKYYYVHLSRYSDCAVDGQEVATGELIGYMGQTGEAGSPHLHYMIRDQNDNVLPEQTFRSLLPIPDIRVTNPLTQVATIYTGKNCQS